jgi:glycosyltransferase involved in cell wall biosynthesis
MKLCVDLIYLNSTGGRNLVEVLTKNFNTEVNNLTFLVDERLNINLNNNFQIIYLKGNEFSRNKHYMANNYDTIYCFGNVPPLVPKKAKVYCYLHNILYFMNTAGLGFNFKTRIKFKIKSIYIQMLLGEKTTILVQTKHFKNILKAKFKKNEFKLKPFFKEKGKYSYCENKQKTISFFYPSMGSPHKNHLRLLKAWEDGGNKLKNITLTLTVNEKSLSNYINKLNLKGFKIVNNGLIYGSELEEKYNNSTHVIYPSLAESFGLVLIESIQRNKIILCSDLDYSREIIKPDFTFDPFKTDSILNEILNSLNCKQSKGKIITKNFINQLT